MEAAIPPQAKSKQLRACLLCSIIQHPADFRKNGCPNCEELVQVRSNCSVFVNQKLIIYTRLQLKGASSDRQNLCTSQFFDGIVAVIDPEASWVARWQRTCEFCNRRTCEQH
jgi:transcription elongation factor SPT4